MKGEVVLVIDRAGAPADAAAGLEPALRAALARQSLKDAVAGVAAALGLPRREVYQAALRLGAAERANGAGAAERDAAGERDAERDG